MFIKHTKRNINALPPPSTHRGSNQKLDFSIIIPVYNVDLKLLTKLIDRLQKSFLRERKIAYEIILVDDGSKYPDNYKHLAQKYGIVYLTHSRNLSLFQARITGLSSAKGDFILSIDADDLLLNMDWSALLKLFTDNEIDVISLPMQCSVSPLIKGDLKHALVGKIVGQEVYKQFASEVNWNFVGKVYRATVIKRFLCLVKRNSQKSYINIAEDFCLTTCLFTLVRAHLYTDSVGRYFYYLHEGTLTRNDWHLSLASTQSYLEQLCEVRRLIFQFFKDNSVEKDKYDKLNSMYCLLFQYNYPKFKPWLEKQPNLYELMKEAFPKDTIMENDVYLLKQTQQTPPTTFKKFLNYVFPPYSVRRVLLRIICATILRIRLKITGV